MDPLSLIGSLVGAGTKLLGGIMGNNTQQDQIAQQANVAQQNRLDQLFYAQHGIQMKVQDAKDAGLNPLAALGASGISPSPVSVGVVNGNPLGDAMGDAGQTLGRAVAAASPQAQRQSELEAKLLEAKIANVNSDTIKNTADASRMATTVGAPGLPPSFPLPRPDPRGPVIPLMQRAWDPRTNEVVWIPSDKAASPLQTLAASSTNAALAGRSFSEGLTGWDAGVDSFKKFFNSGSRGDAWRASAGTEYGVIP